MVPHIAAFRTPDHNSKIKWLEYTCSDCSYSSLFDLLAELAVCPEILGQFTN